MGTINEGGDSIDWEEVYGKLYAYTHKLVKAKTWFRGEKTDTFLGGKTVHDYVMDAIEKYLVNPESFDPSKKRSLINYLKLHVIRHLVDNDSKSAENTRMQELHLESSEDDDDDNKYAESLMPCIEAFFDEELDYVNIMAYIENELKNDKIAEEIFLGTCTYGLKRNKVISEFGMSEKDFDNGMRRLTTILKNTAMTFGIKKSTV